MAEATPHSHAGGAHESEGHQRAAPQPANKSDAGRSQVNHVKDKPMSDEELKREMSAPGAVADASSGQESAHVQSRGKDDPISGLQQTTRQGFVAGIFNAGNLLPAAPEFTSHAMSNGIGTPRRTTSPSSVPVAAGSSTAPSETATRESTSSTKPGTSTNVGVVASKGAYPDFVEKFKHPSALPVVDKVREFLNQFPPSLSRSQAARRIHDFLATNVPVLAAAKVFAEADGDSGDATFIAAEGLEKFLVLKLFKLLFRHAPADLREDEHVESCLQQASPGSLPDAVPQEAQELFGTAALELRNVDKYRAPRDKIVCMLNAYRIVEGIYEDYCKSTGDNGSSISLHQVLQPLLIQAAPPHFYSNLEFVSAFRHPSRLTSEEQRCLQDYRGALQATLQGASAASGANSKVESVSPSSGSDNKVLPPWLVDAGITFHFEDRAPGDLLIGELDELLDEYHRMLRTLRELADSPKDSKAH